MAAYKLREKLYKMLRSNDGSGVVTVLITITFIAVLGAALLFMSYVNVQMKSSDRKSRINFYNAESAMNEIRAGVQEIVTDSIATAYSSALVQYAASSETQDTFAREFILGLNEGAVLTVSLPPGAVNAVGSYEVAELESFLSDAHRDKSVVTGNGIVRVDLDKREVTLGGLSVQYTHLGYETNISTDITIRIPDFAYTVADYSLSRLYQYLIIADEQLTDNVAQQVDVRGNVYAGEVNLGPGAKLTVADNSTIISGGNFNIDNSASLTVDGRLWGQSVMLGGSFSELGITGDTYLANDLVLGGNGSRASITGRYYGFGQGAAGSESSSVIVSGLETRLDLAGVTDLLLAGQSYVSGGELGADDREVVLAGSVSVKSDQTAFLVPDDLLTFDGRSVSNPFVLTNAQAAQLSTLLEVDTATPFLGDHSIDSLGAGVVAQIRMLPSAADYKLIYVFMSFPNGGSAADYYEDYYEQNEDSIRQYLSRYLAELDIGDDIRAAGTSYTYGSSIYDLVRSGGTNVGTIAALFSQRYQNIISSLTETAGGGSGVTPFNHFVNVPALAGLGNNVIEFADSDGTVIGLLVPAGYYAGNGVFTIGDEYPDVNVIIAQGNVALEREFVGLIMSSGSVELRHSITNQHQADHSLTNAAFNAKNPAGKMLIEFMNGAGTGSSSGGAGQEISWVLEDIVVFSNWKKN